MKPKSPLAGTVKEATNIANQSRDDSSRIINPTDYAMDNVRHELETKIKDCKSLIYSIYKDIKESNIDEVQSSGSLISRSAKPTAKILLLYSKTRKSQTSMNLEKALEC